MWGVNMKNLNEFINTENLWKIDETENFTSYDTEQFLIHLYDYAENNDIWYYNGVNVFMNFINKNCINHNDFLCFRYYPDDTHIFVNLRSEQFEIYDYDFENVTIETNKKYYYKIIKLLVNICN